MTVIEDAPPPRRRVPWRLMFTAAGLVFAAAVVTSLLMWAIIDDQHDDERHDRQNKAECLTRGGIVRTDRHGWFDGCYYADHPIEELP